MKVARPAAQAEHGLHRTRPLTPAPFTARSLTALAMALALRSLLERFDVPPHERSLFGKDIDLGVVEPSLPLSPEAPDLPKEPLLLNEPTSRGRDDCCCMIWLVTDRPDETRLGPRVAFGAMSLRRSPPAAKPPRRGDGSRDESGSSCATAEAAERSRRRSSLAAKPPASSILGSRSSLTAKPRA